MNKYVKGFFTRGLCFGGFGPIVTAIVYFIISESIDSFSLSATEVLVATVSTYLLAFIHAGASILNTVEHWSPLRSTLTHLPVLYFAYTGCYLVNSWIPFDPIALLIFSAGFLLIYAVVVVCVIISVRLTERHLNEKLKKQ